MKEFDNAVQERMKSGEWKIEDPLLKMLEGMKEFDNAVQERIKSEEWKDDRLDEIDALNQEFVRLRRTAIRLANDNW